MAEKEYYLDYNVSGAECKRLVQAISTFVGADATYLGAPTFAYEVNNFYIDRNGVVCFDGNEEVEGLIEILVNEGFISLISNLDSEE